MYLGNYVLGDEVVLLLHATAGLVAVSPTAAPVVRVYDADGTAVAAVRMSAQDRSRTPGLFRYDLALDGTYAVGRYLVAFTFTSGGVVRVRSSDFDVVAGGDPDGAVVSMYHHERPGASTLVQKTDGGKRFLKKGARI